MKSQNVGNMDAALRGLLGLVVLGLAASLNDRPFLAIGAALIALVLFGTALTRVCPLYAVLGLNTAHPDTKPRGA
jgi:DUF2892 family protein